MPVAREVSVSLSAPWTRIKELRSRTERLRSPLPEFGERGPAASIGGKLVLNESLCLWKTMRDYFFGGKLVGSPGSVSALISSMLLNPSLSESSGSTAFNTSTVTTLRPSFVNSALRSAP